MSEKSCKDCTHHYTYKNVSQCDAHNFVIDVDKNQHLTFANHCICYAQRIKQQEDTNKFEKKLQTIVNQEENDAIKPNHYKQGKLTCDEICESMCTNREGIEAAYVFNIIKYIYRYNMKNGIEDVCKAREYCDFLIAHLENKNNEKF